MSNQARRDEELAEIANSGLKTTRPAAIDRKSVSIKKERFNSNMKLNNVSVPNPAKVDVSIAAVKSKKMKI